MAGSPSINTTLQPQPGLVKPPQNNGGIGGFFGNIGNQISSMFQLPAQQQATRNSQTQAQNIAGLVNPPNLSTANGPAYAAPKTGLVSLTPKSAATTPIAKPPIKPIGSGSVPPPITPPQGGAPVVPPPVTPPVPNAAANTYSGGVNGNGQSFPGYVQALGNISSQPSGNFNQNMENSSTAQTGLINLQDPNNPINAPITADTQALKALQDKQAQALADTGERPGTLTSDVLGQRGVEENLFAQQQANAQQALNTAVTNRGQQITALTGAGSTANTAAGAATTQQGTQQQGLATAGGLSAPTAANSLGTYDPLTKTYNQYGGANGGGASTAGGVGAQIQQGGAIQTMTGQQAQAKSLAQNLKSSLGSDGINPSLPNSLSLFQGLASGIQQWIDTQSGDPKYQNYANLINEISSRYASILNQSGGTPTDQSTISHSIINGLAKGQDVQTILDSLDKNATDSINALKGASKNNAASGGTSSGGWASLGD